MPSAARGAKICNRLRKQPQGKARRRALCRSESGFNPWWRRKAEGRGLKKKPHVKKQKQAAGTLQRGERWELGEGRIIREGLFPSMTEMFKHRVKMPPNSRRLKIPNGRIQTQVSRGVGQGPNPRHTGRMSLKEGEMGSQLTQDDGYCTVITSISFRTQYL